ncbi:MAG: hypothetical protein KKF48_00295 [Nanoarchaeota archaeon]|nr:hypothetical protein [Nanoarchaeota archaeon]MBU1027464.1 hypothetical protein [Nanoarchaeota archaeon]
MKKNILFVCKHNRFRSKIAETYFKKINKKFRVKSAGIFKGFSVNKKLVDIGKKFGLKINRRTRGLSEKLIKNQDVVVIVANNVPASLFKGRVKKLIVWKISDTNQKDTKKIKEVIKKIIKRVDGLEVVLR